MLQWKKTVISQTTSPQAQLAKLQLDSGLKDAPRIQLSAPKPLDGLHLRSTAVWGWPRCPSGATGSRRRESAYRGPRLGLGGLTVLIRVMCSSGKSRNRTR